MSQLLLVTTANDLSLPLFFHNQPKNLTLDVSLYEDSEKRFSKILASMDSYTIAYFRDPYNTPKNQGWELKIKPLLERIQKLNLPSIDKITKLDNFLIEDKWRQYQCYKNLMPKTQLLDGTINYDSSIHFLKKRISSRSKGVLFSSDSIPSSQLDNYIVQEKLEIKEEYRIFTLFGQIIQPAEIKSSKTKRTKVKVNRDKTLKINTQLEQFITRIMHKTDVDFAGLDIALTQSGEYKLIEVNRSPQFKAFFEITGVNLASKLLSHYE